jgi:hypothetical protein
MSRTACLSRRTGRRGCTRQPAFGGSAGKESSVKPATNQEGARTPDKAITTHDHGQGMAAR